MDVSSNQAHGCNQSHPKGCQAFCRGVLVEPAEITAQHLPYQLEQTFTPEKMPREWQMYAKLDSTNPLLIILEMGNSLSR